MAEEQMTQQTNQIPARPAAKRGRKPKGPTEGTHSSQGTAAAAAVDIPTERTQAKQPRAPRGKQAKGKQIKEQILDGRTQSSTGTGAELERVAEERKLQLEVGMLIGMYRALGYTRTSALGAINGAVNSVTW